MNQAEGRAEYIDPALGAAGRGVGRRDPAEAAHNIERHIVRALGQQARVPLDNLLDHR